MPIRVHCSNPECKKLLSVPDHVAGKKCRCPACKSEIAVPAAAAPVEDVVDAEPETIAFSEKPQPARKSAPPQRKPDLDRDDDDEDEDEDEDPRPRGKVRRKRRDRDLDDDDEDEDHDDDGDSRDRPREKPHPCTPLNLLQFLLGAGFLVGLAFMPLLPWLSVSGEMISAKGKDSGTMTVTGLGKAAGDLPDLKQGTVVKKEGQLAPAGRPEGLLLMVEALIVGGLALLAYLLAMTGMLGRGYSRYTATAAVLVLIMASVLFLVWQLSWVWKTVTLAEVMRKEAERPQAEVQIGGGRTMTSSTFPGLGLFIGLGLAVAAAYVLSNLASRITRGLWCRLAELGGLLLGGLILGLVVRAWQAQALWDAIRAL